jgi:hypothetical protein
MLNGMPITWTADPEQPFVFVWISDPYTFDEWRTALVALSATPAYQTHRTILADRRQAAAPTQAFANDMVEFLRGHPETIARHAAVVVGDDTSYGMSRMIELKTEVQHPELKMRTFRDMNRAIAWLSGEGD